MNKRQELIDELIKADQDGTYKTYKSTEEIKAKIDDTDYIFQHEKLSIRQKNTHKLLKVEKHCKLFKSIKGTKT